MDFVQASVALSNPKGPFYLRTNPEIPDFTNPESAKDVIVYQHSKDSITLPLARETLKDVTSFLTSALFQSDRPILSWGIKGLLSHVYYLTGSRPTFGPKVVDMKVLGPFLGILERAPKNFQEAAGLAGAIFKSNGWPRAKDFYQKVHLPLITEVLPDLEAGIIYDGVERKALHAYYEIEGQVNGRLSCPEMFKRSYNPHSLSPELKERLCPPAGETFLSFDYRNMEVSVLQWLSGDERLREILALDEDFYRVVFKVVTGKACDTDGKRAFAKSFLLPVFYGLSAPTLAEKHGISLEVADRIVSRVRELFSRAWHWLYSQVPEPGQPCQDYFGRRRIFEDRTYRALNFLVQSPASAVCLVKLIELHRALKGCARLVCHVHDGYIVTAVRTKYLAVAGLVRDVLESESTLFPGLKLKVSAGWGDSLNSQAAL